MTERPQKAGAGSAASAGAPHPLEHSTAPDAPQHGTWPAGVRREEVRIVSHPSGIDLAASLYLPAEARQGGTRLPGLLVVHGGGSNRRRHEPFSLQAAAEGMIVLALDLRGHGESGGELDGPLEQDILAAADFLRQHALVDPERIGYRGSSMGGYYGLRAAVAGDFRALALLCPATADVLLSAVGDETGRHRQADGRLALRYDAGAARAYWQGHDVLEDAERIEAPVLLVHARGDEVVPFEKSLQIAARLRGPAELIVLPDGHHRSAQASPEMGARVARWLAERLG